MRRSSLLTAAGVGTKARRLVEQALVDLPKQPSEVDAKSLFKLAGIKRRKPKVEDPEVQGKAEAKRQRKAAKLLKGKL